MTSASADSELPRLVASAPNGRQRLRDCETEREKECEKLREICIFTNRRLQLVALAIEFALSNKRKPTVGREEKKKKNKDSAEEKIQFNFFFRLRFGFGLNKRLAINCVLIFVSHFEMGSQSFFSSGRRHCK